MITTGILAQAAETVSVTSQETTQVVPVDWIYEQITSLTWFQAVIAVSFGVIYLLYGWRIFKVLVVISFALLGLFAGMKIAETVSETGRILGSVIGMGVLAVVSIPLMRWAVCILGAAAGGMLTSGVWYACELPEQFIWAGGLVGIVAGGMISFIIFKMAVMLFTSLAGTTITMTGLLALFHLYQPTTEQVNDLVHNQNWFLPLVLIVPTIVGMAVQNKLVRNSPNWEL